MTPPISGLDHALVGVADLDRSRDCWRALGFTVTPRGRHIGWGTANYCLMFPDDYVELLGIVDAGAFTNGLDEVLAQRGEGLLGIALASADAEAVHQAFPDVSLGVSLLSRRLELPEGTVLPRFRLCRLAPAATPGLSAFVCQHLSRELIWRADWLRHDNGAIGVAGVTVVVADPSALAPPWRMLMGDAAVADDRDGTVRIALGPRYELRLTTPGRFAADTGFAAPPDRTVPSILTIRVADLAATAAFLRQRSIGWSQAHPAHLAVPPAHASGVVLEFVAG